MSDESYTMKQIEKAGRDHMRLAAGHGLAHGFRKKKAEEVGPKHPDYAKHQAAIEHHGKMLGRHLATGEALMKFAGRPMWERENSYQVMDGEVDNIAKHPHGASEGIRNRHAIVSRRIPDGLTLDRLHVGRKKPGHETTAAELSKPFAHEHQVLSHVHHIIADHHEALANKAQRKQAPLSPPSHDFLRHSSVAEKHRAAGLHHANKAGDRPNHEEMRHVIEHHVEHHPIHGMKRPEKAHELLRHFTKKIGGHGVHASAKENGSVAKKHYMLSHAHSRIARHAAFTGDVSGHLEHMHKAVEHRKAGDKLLPEKSREAHFHKAAGSLNHAVGRKLAQYAGPLRDFVEKHEK